MTQHERREQKHRTREALLAGARALMNEGRPITVTSAAKVAGVSKATAYRYFKEPTALAAEAGLALLLESYEEVTKGQNSLEDRLLAINLYFFDLAIDNEAAFRVFLARSMEAAIIHKTPFVTRRGARRIGMYETALQNEGLSQSDPKIRLLCQSLSTATGAEAMIAMLDVNGLAPEEARETVREMTLAIIARFLD